MQAVDEGTSYTGQWNRSTRRTGGANHAGPAFYFGRNGEGNYDVGTATGKLTTREINLSQEVNVDDANQLQLLFSYLLQTETTDTNSVYDKARVIVQEYDTTTNQWPSGVNGTLLASNRTGAPSTLVDQGPSLPVAANAPWSQASISLDSYRGKIIRLIFDFDSIDNLANNFEGWYVDNIEVKRIPKQLTTSSQVLTDTASSLAGICDYNGDGRTDLALVNSASIKVYHGGTTATVGSILTPSNGTFANYTVASANGNVFGNANDELLVNSDAGPSFMIAGGTPGFSVDLTAGASDPYAASTSTKRLATGRLIALGNVSDVVGDVNSIGKADLAIQGFETSDPTSELGASLKHSIGRIYFGSAEFLTLRIY